MRLQINGTAVDFATHCGIYQVSAKLENNNVSQHTSVFGNEYLEYSRQNWLLDFFELGREALLRTAIFLWGSYMDRAGNL